MIGKLTAHEIVYRRLREMILFGELAPGQAVTIQGLVVRLDCGTTPVREAIRHLTAEGALVLKGNRRIAVPKLSLSQLDELSFARLTIEPHLAKLATSNMTEGDIQPLEEADRRLEEAIEQGDIRTYLKQNHIFHHGLYAFSAAPILTSITDGLWLRAGPSLRVVCGRIGTANLPDMHEEALAAMRAGDADAAAHAIKDDIRQGHELVRESLEQQVI